MRTKSIEGFVVLYVHSNVMIIDDIIWKTTLLKKLKKSSFQLEKRDHSTLCSTILTTLTINRSFRDLQLNERTNIIRDYYS